MKETTGNPFDDQKQTKKDWFKQLPIWKKISFATLCAPFYYAYRGFIASTLYGWLILPIFPSLPSINMWQAFGIIITAAQFGSPTKLQDIKEDFLDKDQNLDTAVRIVKPFIILLFGYLLHLVIS